MYGWKELFLLLLSLLFVALILLPATVMAGMAHFERAHWMSEGRHRIGFIIPIGSHVNWMHYRVLCFALQYRYCCQLLFLCVCVLHFVSFLVFFYGECSFSTICFVLKRKFYYPFHVE